MRLKKTYILAAITILLILFAVLTFRKIALLQQQLYTMQPGEVDLQNIPSLITNSFSGVYVFLTLTIAIAIFSFIYFAFIEVTKEFSFVRELARKEEEESVQEDIELGELEEEISETEKISKQKEYIDRTIEKIKNTAFHKEYSLEEVCDKILSIISKEIEIVQGEIFILDHKAKEKKIYNLVSTFAYYLPEEQKESFEYGEGLVGQVAKGKDVLTLNNIPEEYIKVTSGLGESTPSNLTIIPVAKEERISTGVIELATFQKINPQDTELLKAIAEQLGNFLEEKMDFSGFEQVDEIESLKKESTKKTTQKSTTGKETKNTAEKEQKKKEKHTQNIEMDQPPETTGNNKKTIDKEKQEAKDNTQEKNKETGQQDRENGQIIEKDREKDNKTNKE